jgi:hypothetical protein
MEPNQVANIFERAQEHVEPNRATHIMEQGYG